MPQGRRRRSPNKIPSTQRRGRVAGGGTGERTAQVLKIQDQLYWSMILWAQQRTSPTRKVLLGDVYDEALTWFLTREALTAFEAYRAVPLRDARKRCLWVDSRLLERAEKVAERDGVPRNRVLFTALTLYLKEFGPAVRPEDIARLRKIKSVPGERGRPITLGK